MNKNNIRLALVFKDFAAWVKSSCVGLNVAGYTSAAVLNEHGINTVVFPVRHNVDIVTSIDKYNESHKERLTHVIISAPWLSTYDLKNILNNYKDIQFVILSHSNVGFLQADPCGMSLFRQYAELTKVYKNLKIGGNCPHFSEWFRRAYKEHCLCLPNLYPINRIEGKLWDGRSTIKIGCFGVVRPEKNFMTAAAAALEIHSRLNIPIEVHMSTGGENCKSTTLNSISQMLENIDGVTLIRHDWQTWDKFIKLIARMDLLISTSFTESFHMVTADGISRGVPSVVSPVVYWAPKSWMANPDDTSNVADVGISLLRENQKEIGFNSLREHNHKSIEKWIEYLVNS